MQSLNYYSKKRGKLIDGLKGLFSHDPFLYIRFRRETMFIGINMVYFLSLHDVEIEFPSNLERVTFR